MTELRVVATAGHVDHGKSSLIVRLTGMDPDRWEEEKRRGLTIDLGYAWCALPSGREVGFVDVPGHERFVANMLAGVGPVRLVLFVVAAERRLAATVRGTPRDPGRARDRGGRDRAHEAGPRRRRGHSRGSRRRSTSGSTARSSEVPRWSACRRRPGRASTTSGRRSTACWRSRRLPRRRGPGCSSIACSRSPGRARWSPAPWAAGSSRSETRWSSTRTPGTLASGRSRPTSGARSVWSRSRGSPPTSWGRAGRTSLAATSWAPRRRGGRPRRSRASSGRSAASRTRSPARGAFKVYAGASEADATLRIFDGASLEAGGEAYVRITTRGRSCWTSSTGSSCANPDDRKRSAGGSVLDPAPPRRAGRSPESRLARRAAAARDELPAILADERGAVHVSEALLLTGSSAGVPRGAGWLFRQGLLEDVGPALVAARRGVPRSPSSRGGSASRLRPPGARRPRPACERHARPPVDRPDARSTRRRRPPRPHEHLDRVAPRVPRPNREATHSCSRSWRRSRPSPRSRRPSRSSWRRGTSADAIDAAIRAGLVVRVAPDLVFLPALIDRAREIVARSSGSGITVSAFREALGTSRKYAVPLLEWFDQRGITRRDGDLRFPRSS